MLSYLRTTGLAVLLALALAPAAGAWTWPASGPVLQRFKLGSDPYAGGQSRGIVVGGAEGEAVLAPREGNVSFAGSVPTYGLSVTIVTDDGYSVTLVHLGSISVKRGLAVAEGAVVGTVGTPGAAPLDTPYVHLGVRRTADPNGYLDPLQFLPARPAGEDPSPPSPTSTPAPANAPPPTPAPASAPSPVVVPGPEPTAPSPPRPQPSPPVAIAEPVEPAPAEPAASEPVAAAPAPELPAPPDTDAPAVQVVASDPNSASGIRIVARSGAMAGASAPAPAVSLGLSRSRSLFALSLRQSVRPASRMRLPRAFAPRCRRVRSRATPRGLPTEPIGLQRLASSLPWPLTHTFRPRVLGRRPACSRRPRSSVRRSAYS